MNKEYGAEMHIGNYLKEGWSLYKRKIEAFTGFTALFLLITVILNFIPIVGPIIYMGIGAPLVAGYYIVALKLVKNEPTQFGDFFKGFDYFMPLFLAGLIGGILTWLGFLLLILPGIYLLVGYLFTKLFIIDKKMDFWQAMEVSRKLITKNWFSVFGFLLIIVLINFLGSLPLMLGLLISVPFSLCAITIAYDDIVGIEKSL